MACPLTSRSTRTRTGSAPQGARVIVHLAARRRCVPVTSNVSLHRVMLRLLFVPLLSVLGACGAPVKPYPILDPASSARIQVQAEGVSQFFFMSDGEKCTDYAAFTPDQDPLRRIDRSLLVEPGKRSAIQLIWNRGISACWVIISFKLAPRGEYLLKGSLGEKQCYASIEPLNEASAEGLEIRQMVWTPFGIPSPCHEKRVK